MARLASTIDPASDAFRANRANMERLVAELRRELARAERGGSDEARARHTARGKLLPRERLAQLLDLGAPFLEIGQFAAWGL